jgi:asparagine synthase (glutamine-hydrolysing)
MRTPSTTGESGPLASAAARGLPAAEAATFLVGVGADDVRVRRWGRPAVARQPGVRLLGRWTTDEFRTADLGFATVVLFGHCLPAADELARRARATLAAGRGQEADRLLTDGQGGAFACLVVWPDRMALYTDVAAQFPVYHSTSRGRTLFGSDPRLLAALHQREPDPLTAALRVACTDVLPLWERRSAFEGISRLPGGHVVEVARRAGADPRVRLYMRGTRVRQGSGITRAEGAAALGVALRRAVDLRCGDGSAVTADFSGGLDSTSLALLAAQSLPDGATLPVVVYHQPAAPAGDLADAQRCAQQASGVRLTVLHGTNETLPYAAGHRAEACAQPAWPTGPEPWGGAVAWRRSAARLAFAAEHGAGIHLTGEGGDALLSAPPAYLADLAGWRSTSMLFAHATAQSRARDVSRLRTVARARRLKRTNLAAALLDLSRQVADSKDDLRVPGWLDAVSWWPVVTEPLSWLTASARRSIADSAEQAACSQDDAAWRSDAGPAGSARAAGSAGPAELAAATALRLSAEAQAHLRELGRSHGVAVHAPFLDPEVVCAALSVPAALRADPRVFKPLLGMALPDLEPRALFDRHTKGDYTGEDYLGMRRHGEVARALLDSPRLADLGVVEPDRVRRSLSRLRAGLAVPLGPLNQLLATEAWLRGLESGDAGSW